MRRSACITLVIASAAMLAAGISTRGARADRSIDVDDGNALLLRIATTSQRPQPGPRTAPQHVAAQGAVDIAVVAAFARHPAVPMNARDVRNGDAIEEMATLEVRPNRKMRAISVDLIELPVETPVHGQRGESGVAAIARAAAPTMVININFAGLGF